MSRRHKILKRAMSVLVLGGLVIASLGLAYAEEASFPGIWKKYPGVELRITVEEVPMFLYMRQKLPEFEKLTGIKATIEILPEIALRQKVLLDFALRRGYYDVIGADMIDVVQYATGGFIVPLNQYIEDSELTDKSALDMDDLFANYMEGLTVEGKLYGFPTYIDGLMLMYRRDLFEKYGIAEAPKTWDEYYDIAKKLLLDTDGDGNIDIYGNALRCKRGMNSNIYLWTSMFRGWGGYFFDEEMKPVVNSSAGIGATDYYVKLLKDTAPPGVGNYGWTEVETAMEQGKVAMIVDAYDFPPRMEDPEMSTVVGKLGYDIIPAGKATWRGKKHIPSMYTLAATISEFSKNKEAAWMFVKWATSKTLAYDVADKGSYSWLIRKSTLDSEKYRKASRPFWDGLKRSIPLSDSEYRPRIPEWREVEDAVSIAVSEAFSGTKSTKKALDDANTAIYRVLKEAGYYQ